MDTARLAGTGMKRLGPPPSKEHVIEALMRDPATTECAALIPASGNGGRPRLYPNWCYILFNALVSHFQTGGKVQTELGDPRTWLLVRTLARELFPEDQQPPEQPMRWHHYKYAKNRYLSREDTLTNYRRIHREGACTLAREAGNFADRGFSIHPTFSNTTAADGKVVATRSKARPKDRRLDRRTGKRVRARVEPDKKPHVEGDGSLAWA
jgi:hypothetical protein